MSEGKLRLSYKGEVLKQVYEPDFVCFEAIIVEIKAVNEIAPEHRAQLINYLKATGIKLGLLVNFGSRPHVNIERFVLQGQDWKHGKTRKDTEMTDRDWEGRSTSLRQAL